MQEVITSFLLNLIFISYFFFIKMINNIVILDRMEFGNNVNQILMQTH